MKRELSEWPWQYLDGNDVGGTRRVRTIARWPVYDATDWAIAWPLLAGLATLKIALPASAESAVAATSVDDGLAADEEVGDAL